MPVCIHFMNIQKTEGNVRSPETVVRDGCEQSCGYWLLNPGLLQEQPMFLSTELSFQPPNVLIFSYESCVFNAIWNDKLFQAVFKFTLHTSFRGITIYGIYNFIKLISEIIWLERWNYYLMLDVYSASSHIINIHLIYMPEFLGTLPLCSNIFKNPFFNWATYFNKTLKVLVNSIVNKSVIQTLFFLLQSTDRAELV